MASRTPRLPSRTAIARTPPRAATKESNGINGGMNIEIGIGKLKKASGGAITSKKQTAGKASGSSKRK